MSETEKPNMPPQPGAEPSNMPNAGASPTVASPTTDTPPIDIAAVLQARVVVLEAREKELEGQQVDLTDRLLRAHAEMDNVRKRTERDKADSVKYANTKFALDIVGVSDNFQRAVAAIPPGAAETDGTLKSLAEGILMTERAFHQVLERHGVKRIDPMGEPFNPNLHQAVMEQQNTDVAAGSVLQVFQSGYMIEDRVLRPAMVVVARGGFKPAKSPEQAGDAQTLGEPANDDRPGGSQDRPAGKPAG